MVHPVYFDYKKNPYKENLYNTKWRKDYEGTGTKRKRP
jgi:hypothetical protein